MKSIIITGNKKSPSKEFFVGEYYEIDIVVDYYNRESHLVKCVEIEDKIVFQDLFTQKLYRSPISQFDIKTKHATSFSDMNDSRRYNTIDCVFNEYFTRS